MIFRITYDLTLPIVNFQLPIGVFPQQAIGNWQSAIGNEYGSSLAWFVDYFLDRFEQVFRS